MILLEDYTDADMTLQRPSLRPSDLPQFVLPAICDPIAPAPAPLPAAQVKTARRPTLTPEDAARIVDGLERGPSSIAPMAIDPRPRAATPRLRADSTSEFMALRLDQRARRSRVIGLAAGAALVAAFAFVALSRPSVSSAPAAAGQAGRVIERSQVQVSQEALSSSLDPYGIVVPDRNATDPVFIDGVEETLAPAPVRVSCGQHRIRIGERPEKLVLVPCGGAEVVVEP